MSNTYREVHITTITLAARREAHLQVLHRVCQRGGYPHQVFGFLISKALLGTTRENGTVQGSHGLTLKRYRDMRFHPQDGQSLYETYLDEFDKTSGLCGDDQFRGHHEEALRPLRDKLDDSTSVQDVLRERPQITADQEARFKSILGHLVRETCFAGYLSCYKKCPPGQSRDVYEAGIVGDWCNSVRKNVQEALRAGVGTVESPR